MQDVLSNRAKDDRGIVGSTAAPEAEFEDLMQPELWSLYTQMLNSRLFEQAVAQLWKEGRISGEMHLGLGEEAVAAGVVSHLREGDGLAVDHRGTPPLLVRGVDPVRLLRELLGCDDGLCAGMGGHMHLFSPQHLAASSGIVGAAGPAAVGFALAAQILRPGCAAAAFFGEGAMNQGSLLEAFNLAAAWHLPVLFVCKNSQWAASSRSADLTGGSLLDRAYGFGLRAAEVDGREVLSVWQAARELLDFTRQGRGPAFLLAHVPHLEGHMLGDMLLDMARRPARAFRKNGMTIVRGLLKRPGAPFAERLRAVGSMNAAGKAVAKQTHPRSDPLVRARNQLVQEDAARLAQIEDRLQLDIDEVVKLALQP